MTTDLALKESLFFVKTLTDYLDQIQAHIPGEDWPELQQEIYTLIEAVEVLMQSDISDEAKALQINAQVDDLFDLFMRTPVESLVREIDQEARGQAGTRQVGTLMSVTVAGDTRQVATGLGEGADQPLSPETLLAAFEFLKQQLTDYRPSSMEFESAEVEPFSAYPRLDAPTEVEPEATFEVIVGFRAEADPSLDTGDPIVVESPDPDKNCLVILRAEGAEVVGEHYGHLPLKQNAAVIFTCRARVDVAEILLSVDYFYDNQPIGLAQRRVRLSTAPPADDNPDDTEVETPPPKISLLSPAQAVDMVLVINKINQGLSWIIASRHLDRPPVIDETDLPNPREFSAEIIRELKTNDFRDLPAYTSLTNIGADIASKLPPQFFTMLQAVQQTIGQKPTLLILTDEPYVPWELAFLSEPFDIEAYPFLATQTVVGRWFYDASVSPLPPITLKIEHATIAASDYSDTPRVQQLAEALQEQQHLCDLLRQCHLLPHSLAMTQTEFAPFLYNGETKPGHLLHIAAHGLSDPAANDQSLLYADRPRRVLTPRAMVPARLAEQPARFSFVFLNACQVGTAGETLGQAAGFPGVLIRNGVQGFIAPLWEIHETDARELAEAFYEAAFGDEAQPLAEFLHEWRLNYDQTGSTTPLSYIFYGHPRLRLEVNETSSDGRITGEPE